MIRRIRLILIFTVFISSLMAQPVNDDCMGAIEITDFDGECISFNTTGSSFDLANGDCLDDPGSNNIWFRFVAEETDLDILVNGGSNNMFVTLLEFVDGPSCDFASAVQVDCGSSNGDENAISLQGRLTIGDTYYILVSSANNVETLGNICLNNDPNSIPTLGQWGIFILSLVLLTIGVVRIISLEEPKPIIALF